MKKPDQSQAGAEAAEQTLFSRIAQAGNRLYTRLYHQVRVLSPSRLPPAGPAILVCNHTSGLDPLLIQTACKRLIVWMMAREYYDIRWLKWFFLGIDAIPVDRSGRDLAATRAALRALGAGRIVGIFPEGRIETSRELLPFQTGVALLAIKTSVPVYTVYLDGTQRRQEMLPAFLLPQEVRLAFGGPVEFDRTSTSREALDCATQKIRQAISTLRKDSERRKIA